jgi:hypothetical protein
VLEVWRLISKSSELFVFGLRAEGVEGFGFEVMRVFGLDSPKV